MEIKGSLSNGAGNALFTLPNLAVENTEKKCTTLSVPRWLLDGAITALWNIGPPAVLPLLPRASLVRPFGVYDVQRAKRDGASAKSIRSGLP